MSKNTENKFQKIVDKQNEKIERKRVWDAISASEKAEVILQTWEDHTKNRDEIASFTTIVDKNIFNVFARENEVLLPFSEFRGDHADDWIICWNLIDKKEIFRKNIRQIDMIEWRQPKIAEK